MHSSNISVGKRISTAGYVGRLTDKVKMLMKGWVSIASTSKLDG